MNEQYNYPMNWIKMERTAESLWAKADRLIDRNIQNDSHDWNEINRLQEQAHQMEHRARAAKRSTWR